MAWLEISGTVGRVAACLGFFIAGMAIFYLLTKVIYRIPEKQQLERLHEPGKFRNAGIVIFGGVAAVLFTGFFGMGLQGIIYFLFLAVLTVVTFIDMDTMEIPFMLNVIIFVMGVVSLILQFVSDNIYSDIVKKEIYIDKKAQKMNTVISSTVETTTDNGKNKVWFHYFAHVLCVL